MGCVLSVSPWGCHCDGFRIAAWGVARSVVRIRKLRVWILSVLRFASCHFFLRLLSSSFSFCGVCVLVRYFVLLLLLNSIWRGRRVTRSPAVRRWHRRRGGCVWLRRSGGFYPSRVWCVSRLCIRSPRHPPSRVAGAPYRSVPAGHATTSCGPATQNLQPRAVWGWRIRVPLQAEGDDELGWVDPPRPIKQPLSPTKLK